MAFIEGSMGNAEIFSIIVYDIENCKISVGGLDFLERGNWKYNYLVFIRDIFTAYF